MRQIILALFALAGPLAGALNAQRITGTPFPSIDQPPPATDPPVHAVPPGRVNPALLVAGGLLCAPFTVYLFGFTYLHYFAFLLPFFQFGAAWAVCARRKILAWILLLPLASIMVILAIIVLSQFG